MSSTATLEEKFQAAVKAIQHLPPNGAFQPSNEMKLTFYGLFKQATSGPCQDGRPSVFNPVARAKWDAWDKYRSMSKQEAMTNYIDEIRKILETMPQTNEVLELTRLIGPFYEFVDDHDDEVRKINLSKKRSSHDELFRVKQNHHHESLLNGFGKENHEHHETAETNGTTRTLITTGNGPVPSSSSSSSSSSSMSSSDVDEYFQDPSDRLPIGQGMPNDEILSDRDDEEKTQFFINDRSPNHPGYVFGGQNGNNPHLQRSQTSNHNFNPNSFPSSTNHRSSSQLGRYSPSSIASGGTASGGNERNPNNSYNRETQNAILNALTKLQRDVNNILERLNRLETSTQFLQQRNLQSFHELSHSNTVSRWLPLAGLRRRAIAFILLWPFFVFAVIRLFLRARIIIRFRKSRI